MNRHSLIGALSLAHARTATDALFGMVRPEAFYDRPVSERHRTIFYFGHLEAFDWNLVSQAAGVPSFNPEFDRLFAFGIDPEPGQSPQDTRSDWPEKAEVQRYKIRAREAVDDLSNHVSEQVHSVALEHRLMHAETFAYLLHHLTTSQKDIPPFEPWPPTPTPVHTLIEVSGGEVTLGQRLAHLDGQYQFGWDNEFDGHEVSVSAFAMSKCKVTNGMYHQRAVGSTPTRPTKTINYSRILLLDSVNFEPGVGTKFFRLRVRHVYKPPFATGEPLRTSVWISPHSLSSYDAL